MIRVVVADDEALVRAGFRVMLESEDDIEVVGEARDGAEALSVTREMQPDVLVLDIQMPALDGIETTTRLRAGGAATRVLILTTFDRDDYLYRALQAGASGFLLKTVSPDHLAHAVRTVAAGDSLLDPVLTRRLLDEYVKRPPPHQGTPASFADLTERELDVLREMARGASNDEIARTLFITMSTVKTHVRAVLAKLGVHDRVQAVVMAYQNGLVGGGS
ncbi:MAG: response regulator [Mycobacteriales bacterium]